MKEQKFATPEGEAEEEEMMSGTSKGGVTMCQLVGGAKQTVNVLQFAADTATCPSGTCETFSDSICFTYLFSPLLYCNKILLSYTRKHFVEIVLNLKLLFICISRCIESSFQRAMIVEMPVYKIFHLFQGCYI